ncbi:MAG: ABC transporter permease [Candidatus Hermodarchaeota archaeon]
MGVMQVIGVTQRFGIQVIRSRWTIPYLIIFPAFFIGVYWIGFSASEVGTNQTFQLGVINQDEGFSDEVKALLGNKTIMGEDFTTFHSSDVLEKGFALELANLLNTTKYSNESEAKNIFDVTLLSDLAEGQEKLENRNLDILIIFSPTFSNAMLSMLNQYWNRTYGLYLHEMIQLQFPEAPDLPTHENETTIIMGDDTYITFQLANSILTLILEQYSDLRSAFDSPGGSIQLVFNEEYLVSLPKYSIFDMIIPGLIAFGIILQPSLFAYFVGDEFNPKRRTYDRLHLASLSPIAYTFGTLIIQIPVFIAQTVILFVMALLLGFTPQGNLLLAFCIAMTILPLNAAICYLVAAFFYDEMTIGTVLGFGAPILAYASGAFTALPHLVVLPNFFPTASGMMRDFLLWDLFPLTHVVNALRDVLLYNFTLEQVFADILTGLFLSTIMFIFAIILFAYYRFWRS